MSEAKTANVTVLVLVGSLRAESVNRQLAQTAVANAPDGVRLDLFDRLGELPFYNEDLDVDPAPEAVQALRDAAAEADATLIVTPEYNGSIPGVLKNAIDWFSRPYGKSALKDKPAAVVGAALGQYGGVWAHDETRKSIGVAGLRVIDSVSLSIPTTSLDGRHPQESAEVVDQLRDVVEKLVAEVG